METNLRQLTLAQLKQYLRDIAQEIKKRESVKNGNKVAKSAVAKQVVRMPVDKTYIALDFISESGIVISTPFLIHNGESVEVHWRTPVSERPKYPTGYDDFHDKWLLMMKDGILYKKWLSGPSQFPFSEVEPVKLADWKFECAHKIFPATRMTTDIPHCANFSLGCLEMSIPFPR